MTPREFKDWLDLVHGGNRTAAARALSRARSTLWRWERGAVPIPARVAELITAETKEAGG